jgi:hypothetical protein
MLEQIIALEKLIVIAMAVSTFFVAMIAITLFLLWVGISKEQ